MLAFLTRAMCVEEGPGLRATAPLFIEDSRTLHELLIEIEDSFGALRTQFLDQRVGLRTWIAVPQSCLCHKISEVHCVPSQEPKPAARSNSWPEPKTTVLGQNRPAQLPQ